MLLCRAGCATLARWRVIVQRAARRVAPLCGGVTDDSARPLIQVSAAASDKIRSPGLFRRALVIITAAAPLLMTRLLVRARQQRQQQPRDYLSAALLWNSSDATLPPRPTRVRSSYLSRPALRHLSTLLCFYVLLRCLWARLSGTCSLWLLVRCLYRKKYYQYLQLDTTMKLYCFILHIGLIFKYTRQYSWTTGFLIGILISY